jgi:hypothetical protein
MDRSFSEKISPSANPRDNTVKASKDTVKTSTTRNTLIRSEYSTNQMRVKSNTEKYDAKRKIDVTIEKAKTPVDSKLTFLPIQSNMSEPRRVADVAAAADVSHGFPSIAPFDRLRNLMLRQLRFSPKFYSSGHGSGPAFASP